MNLRDSDELSPLLTFQLTHTIDGFANGFLKRMEFRLKGIDPDFAPVRLLTTIRTLPAITRAR